MDQIDSLREHLLPRVFCYFDDLHLPEKYISDINGVALAIKEFNSSNVKFKFGKNVDHIMDFKFPLAKSLIYMLHHFDHHDYNKFIGEAYGDDLDIKSTKN